MNSTQVQFAGIRHWWNERRKEAKVRAMVNTLADVMAEHPAAQRRAAKDRHNIVTIGLGRGRQG